VLDAGASRRQLTRTLNAAYADGLISEHTFVRRLEHVLKEHLIDPHKLVGDLSLRAPRHSLRTRLSSTLTTVAGLFASALAEEESPTLLALDWTGEQSELVLGRSSRCDVVVSDLTVSRRHARLFFRDGKWLLQDLASTNGTLVNGRRVGRCELRPGDRLLVGEARLRVD
jgi:FHA domain